MAMIFESDTKSKRNKSRNKQERLLQTEDIITMARKNEDRFDE